MSAPPHHQGTDRGEAGGGRRRGKPPEGVPGEPAQVSLHDGGPSAGGETRQGVRETALARRGAAQRTRGRRAPVRGTGERQTAGVGRAGERRGGGVDADVGEGHPPALAGDRQGERSAGARGPEKRTEGSRNPMTCAEVTCLHAGRRVKKRRSNRKPRRRARTHRAKGGGAAHGVRWENKTKRIKIRAPPEDTQHQASGQRKNR